MSTRAVLEEVAAERWSQDQKWGAQDHPDGTADNPTLRAAWAMSARDECNRAAKLGKLTWRHIMSEEVAEAHAESDPAKLRAELIQVAAVAVAWIESIDRRE